MKRNLLLILIFSAFAYYTQAQSLSLSSDSIWVSGEASDPYIQAVVRVNNNSTSSKNVSVKRYRVATLGGSSTDYFCWSICHSPVVDVDPDFITINANSYSDAFYGDLVPNGQTGTATILYTFFDVNNPSDSTQLKVMYNVVATGINTIENKNTFQLYPNPANDIIRVKYNYDSNADLFIYDITGKIVKRESLIHGQSDYTLSIADLKPGVYFYSLNNGKEIISMKKLIKK